MRFSLFLIIFFNTLFASNLLDLFNQKKFKYICMHRWEYINLYEKKNEKLLSLVGYSCLKINYLTPALDLSKVLRYTKAGRVNAMYINELFMIKLLLIRYLEDNYDISVIKLPFIDDNILAKVFYLIQKQKPKIKNGIVEIKDSNKIYKVLFNKKTNDIIIKIFKDDILEKKVRFW
ncbi:hypothetical protein FE773_07375 [Caminibacter mediatlanticus TB-2]|uniref:Outer membrane lipoprotein carrier protein LolA n=1 Tax=Caminibacter mediatlanticus TB-2 TaxID=391592 RepID=A0ABX5V9P5_9BACT|nr:hypothetical protein [Caminibacter mediatlanticus]QCT95015.1 hypothetical protein FE773_07375 [Caminibacter mediatlanticus TB-2]